MSGFNKIPFGLRQSGQQLVDVYAVPNGRQCGCICPSCQTPLEARQGDIKIWHFAHAHKKVYDKTKNECEYSFYLSLRLMAKQLIGKQVKLGLPEYKDRIEYYAGIFRHRKFKEFLVANAQQITIENIAVEKMFSGVAVDVVGFIGDFQFVIYFSHPGRTVPVELFQPDNDHCGIIEVKLDALSEQFMMARQKNKTYDEILSKFLTNDKTAKRWIYHPRYAKKKEQAIKALEQTEQNNLIIDNIHNTVDIPTQETHYETEPYFDNPVSQIKRMAKFKCVLCNYEWEGEEAGGNVCAKCNTHLYARIISMS